ncbi:MAG: hypothetical protein NT076_04020 [Candidatus Pacearchaeota archaeon]|nr:hypothetical protein [Candidatus Pacearchaeota archaeon]
MAKILQKEIKKTPVRSSLTFILLGTLIVAFIEALRQYNWVLMLMIVIISVLMYLPKMVSKLSHINIPLPLGIFVIIFLYASLFLGELKNYYAAYWWWDIVLHTSSGVAFGIIGFIILYILYKTEKIKTNPKTIAMFTFAFAFAIGALWEIVEFTIDSTLGPISNNVLMQGSLKDTMGDLIVDALGALFVAVVGYFYIKNESGIVGIVINPITKKFKKDNPRFFAGKKSK